MKSSIFILLASSLLLGCSTPTKPKPETPSLEDRQTIFIEHRYNQQVLEDVEAIKRDPNAAVAIFKRLRSELRIEANAQSWSHQWERLTDLELYRFESENSPILAYEIIALWAYIKDNGDFVSEAYRPKLTVISTPFYDIGIRFVDVFGLIDETIENEKIGETYEVRWLSTFNIYFNEPTRIRANFGSAYLTISLLSDEEIFGE